jgi:hypothetical protein
MRAAAAAAAAAHLDNDLAVKSSTTVVDYDGCTEIVLPPAMSAAPAASHCRAGCLGTFSTFGRPPSYRSRQRETQLQAGVSGSRHDSALVGALCADLGNDAVCGPPDGDPASDVAIHSVASRSSMLSDGNSADIALFDADGVGYGSVVTSGGDSDGHRCTGCHRHHQQGPQHQPSCRHQHHRHRQHQHQFCRSHAADRQSDPVPLTTTTADRNSCELINISGGSTNTDVDSYPPGLRTPQ